MPGNASRSLLLVEDEAIIALAEKRMLESFGYTVTVAGSGAAAMESFSQGPAFDLILMDIDLGSGLDGTETAELILREHAIPVVFLSSHTEPEVVERTEKITSYGYVVKNSSGTVIDASIKMAFKLFEANRTATEARSRLEATLDALPDELMVVDRDGFCHDHHRPHRAASSQPSEERYGKRLSDILVAPVFATIMDAVREADERGFSFGRNYETVGADGRRWFELSVSRTDGRLADPRIIILHRDITERKQAEEIIRRAALSP